LNSAEWIDGKGFRDAVSELVRLAACELPDDVEMALRDARASEEPGSTAELTLSLFLKNIEMAKERQAPVCQDTGLPIFFISHPEGVSRSHRPVRMLLPGRQQNSISGIMQWMQ
jgi:tartrate dehydratase alpha subunit/fumarate hydratase class I-like protein